MFYLLASILILSLAIFAVNRFSGKVLVCPICAATVLTWAAALLGSYFKLFHIDIFFLAILIAVSLGASTEKFGSKLGLWWKISMVLLGTPAIYYIVQGRIAESGYFLLALLFATAIFAMQFSTKPSKGAYKDIDKGCCN